MADKIPSTVLSVSELKEFLKKNLKLNIRSKKINPQDTNFQFEISLKLCDEDISKVLFTA